MSNIASLPPASSDQSRVSISAIAGGFITLPTSAFVTPSNPSQPTHRTVPSLSFLLHHPGVPASPSLLPSLPTNQPLRILFDLGLRESPSSYPDPQRDHLETRRPYTLFPGVVETLKTNGIDPATDIDLVVLSHVHYDHVGDANAFSKALFVIGPGAGDVLKEGLKLEGGRGSHQRFDTNAVPWERCIELPTPGSDRTGEGVWKPLASFENALDLLGDGSMYVLDTPGHLPGHITLLCRTAADRPITVLHTHSDTVTGHLSRSEVTSNAGGCEDRWLHLAGDTFHDPLLLQDDYGIATWNDSDGLECCIHVDRGAAADSISRVRRLRDGYDVEIIAAHDDGWWQSMSGKIPK